MVAATLDDHAPVTKKRVAIKPNYPWLNEDFRSEKRKRRKVAKHNLKWVEVKNNTREIYHVIRPQ